MASTDGRRAPQVSSARLRLLIDNLEEIIATGILLILVVITAYSVIGRYMLGAPVRWSNELSGLLMVWLIFLGSVGALKRSEHISVGVVVDRLPVAAQTAVRWFGFLVIEVTLAVLFIKGYELARDSSRSALALPIPWTYVYGAVPVFAVLATIRLTQLLVFDYRFCFIAGSSNADQDVVKEATP